MPPFDAAPITTACSACLTHKDCLGGQLQACVTRNAMDVATVTRGTALLRAGDDDRHVYILRRGALKTFVVSADGEEQILAFHSPGDMVGLDAFFGGRHTRNTVALIDSEVCAIPVAAIVESGAQHTALYARLMAAMSREIQRLQGMLKLERLSAEQRIAMFLLNQVQRQSCAAGQRATVALPMSRGEIGRFLDLATETVSRMFTKLQTMGLIRNGRQNVELLNIDGLRRLAQTSATPRTGKIAA